MMIVFKLLRLLWSKIQIELGTLRENWRLYYFRSKGYKVGDFTRFGARVSLNGKVSIGKNVMIVSDARIQGDVQIGDHVIIAPHCTILGANHDFDSSNALPYGTDYIVKRIVIEENVWIGMHVKILGGAIIEEGAVIAMGAVVTGRIPAGAVAAGIPARVIKFRDMDRYERLKKKPVYISLLRRRNYGMEKAVDAQQKLFSSLIINRGFVIDCEIKTDTPGWSTAILYALAVRNRMVFGLLENYYAAVAVDKLLDPHLLAEQMQILIHSIDPTRVVNLPLLISDLAEMKAAVNDPEKVTTATLEYPNWFVPPVL